MLATDVENDLIEFLALTYMRVPWGKMRTSKNPHDIFNHRVRAASRRANIYEFASKLCNYFGLQSISSEAQEVLDRLRLDEAQILNVLSSEHIPYCVRGIIRSKDIRQERKEAQKLEQERRIKGEKLFD